MLNPDEQRKDPSTAEIKDDERAATQRRDNTTIEADSEERVASRPSSTAEVSKDLDRSEAGDKPSAGAATLFPEKQASDFRTRWTDIQTGFVDEPRRSVEQADALVAEVIKRLADSFPEERSRLEGQWGRGDDVSTEDLRVALQRYRAFFDRLLSV
jgi:hypothetical protein